MNCFIIFVTLIFQGLGSYIKDESTSIINGDLANIEDYPYYVFVLNIKTFYACGGSILKPNIILTAGHCTIDDVITVYPGVTVLKDIVASNVYKVKEYLIHPFYNGSSSASISYHDLALLKLERSIPLGPTVQTIQIANEDPKISDEVAVVGFGQVKCDEFDPGSTVCTNQLSSHLKVGILTVAVVEKYRIISGVKDQNVCFGDSGGPLVYDGEIIGVTSIVDTNCTAWSIYTRPSADEHRLWIKKSIQYLLAEEEENK